MGVWAALMYSSKEGTLLRPEDKDIVKIPDVIPGSMSMKWVIALVPGTDLNQDSLVRTLPEYLVGAVEGSVVSGTKRLAGLEKTCRDCKAVFIEDWSLLSG